VDTLRKIFKGIVLSTLLLILSERITWNVMPFKVDQDKKKKKLSKLVRIVLHFYKNGAIICVPH
jgi:hypothetical protein